MGVWRRSPAGLAVARADPAVMAGIRAALPDLRDEDVIGSGTGVVTVVVCVVIVVSAVVSTKVLSIGVSVTAIVLSLTATVLRSGTTFTFVLVPTFDALPDPGAALLE